MSAPQDAARRDAVQKLLAADGKPSAEYNHYWPHTIRPEWIHALLRQWRRQQPLTLLLEQAMDTTAQEQHDLALRRACLTWLISLFIPTLRRAGIPHTLKQNVWASYSHSFGAEALAPIWLARLTEQQIIAFHIATDWRERFQPGLIVSADALWEAYDADWTWRAEHEFFLRSLHHWGVLAPTAQPRQYQVARRLRVIPALFPLLVYTWWQRWRYELIDINLFRRSPLFVWLDPTDFAIGWDAFDGQLWTLEKAQEAHEDQLYARLHATDNQSFVRQLLNLLSTGGRRGRQMPRQLTKPIE